LAEEKQKLVTVSIMLKPEQVAWLDDMTREGRFASRSHGIRVAVTKLMQSEEKKHG